MEIVILDAYSFNPGDIGWEMFEELGHVTAFDLTLPEQIIERIQNADAVFTNRCRLGEAEFSASPKLKFLGLVATGYDKIDLAAARRHNIAVCNVPGYSTAAVAQQVFALLLDLTNRARSFDQEVRKDRWKQTPGDCVWDYPLLCLDGKTFGVIGTGEIGRAAARIARAFGMRVLGYSRSRREGFDGEYVSLDELLRQSDAISLHCPANAETNGMIDRGAIEKMKPGAILINTARGALVNSRDLVEALNSSRLYAAGLDVAEGEPLSGDDLLLTAKNCLVTPHIGWAPLEMRTNLAHLAAKNLRAFLNGTALNRVDLEGRK
ncbi:MAG: D-2-hydroxyacid dehydrogenase [Clostridiaceae bacterium]